MRKIIYVIAALMLSGCSGAMTTKTTLPDGTITETSQPGSIFGPSSYDLGYQSMYTAHQNSKASRATSIQSATCPDDPAAAAYCQSAKMMGIAMMSMEKFDVKAPTTGFDVLYKATDSIVPVAGFGALWQLGKIGIENAGSTFRDGANLNNSMNRTNSQAESIGTNSGHSTANTSGTMPAAEPVVVEPSYGPVQ